MKKNLVLICLSILFFSCSDSVSEVTTNIFEKACTAYDGYQIVKSDLANCGYDTSSFDLISIRYYPNSNPDLQWNMCFSNDEYIGYSLMWDYGIIYKENNEIKKIFCTLDYVPFLNVTVYYEHSYDIGKEYKSINLTKQNDSPIFIKKLIETTNYLKIRNKLLNHKDGIYAIDCTISMDYLSSSNKINTLYWVARLGDFKSYLLSADENMIRNSIECIEYY